MQSESKKVLDNAEQAAVGLELNGVNAHCPQVEGWGFLAATQASPEFPPSCADLSAECKLQPRAVAVKFLPLEFILRYLQTSKPFDPFDSSGQ